MNRKELAIHGSYFARSLKLSICGKPLTTPTYFPSISGAGTRYDLKQLIDLCLNSGYPRVLLSAFDLSNFTPEVLKGIEDKLKVYREDGKFIFLDSGTFEKYWLRNNEWDFKSYEKIVCRIETDFYASFDDFPMPGDRADSIADQIIENVSASIKLNHNGQCLTVCHGPGKMLNVISNLASKRPDLCAAISIPERECGNSIESKVRTIYEIREMLQEKKVDSLIHILGCGNLISMVLYSLAGADSFDSVDWSRWLLDRRNCKFSDIGHISLLDCECRVCSRSNLEGITKAIYHNLYFYQDFLSSFRDSIKGKSESKFLRRYLAENIVSKIVKLFNDNDF